MKNLKSAFLVLLLLASCIPSKSQDSKPIANAGLQVAGGKIPLPLELKSPDGKLSLRFNLKDIGNEKGCPVYNVSYDGRPVLSDSRLGLLMRIQQLAHDFDIIGRNTSSSDTNWKPVNGERSTIRDNYNQLVVELQLTGPVPRARRLTLTFRAYDEGIALNYTLPKANNWLYFDITSELTQFAFTGDHQAWAIYRAQADYAKSLMTVSKIGPGAERPLTIKVEDHLYVAITEAQNAFYPRMKLRPTEGSANTLEAMLDAESARGGLINGSATGKTPFTTPWRVVMVAESPGKLLEQNYLVLNLNEPCKLEDISWIKPGKVIRETTLSTVGGMACIDFAVKHHMQYIEYDAGWYGPEGDPESDARSVEPKRQSTLNLQEVINYGNSKGIGVVLYVNHAVMEQQLDEILPLYEKWGVKGVKYGFVNMGSQFWTAMTHEAIRKAAKYHILVDIHDEFRNTGYQRTYPNLMTVEGIGGNEEFPTPLHNATLPFTRFLTGPADYTYCWTSNRLKNTKSHQLALSTIFFSPWQFLFWYDQPKNVPDEPALEYWDQLPTTWDETRVLQGDIGRRAVVARRKGAEWFLGAIAPVDGKFTIALDFLEAGLKYKAKIYSDAPAIAAKPDKLKANTPPAISTTSSMPGVRIEEKNVDSKFVVNADISANGGMAIHLIPVVKKSNKK
ncbi:MAG: glycoside hydrolase family 97 N-terminal domain-containing protein [Prolixibacteraceae bacterium]